MSYKNRTGYEKKLVSSCDCTMFMSGEIIIRWNELAQDKKEGLRVCRLKLDLQSGDEAVLRLEEIEDLIKNLQTVRDRLL
jgi:hypothetical protein